MSSESLLPTKMEIRRAAWFKKHAKSGMTFTECVNLNDEALRLFPPTKEERRRKTESLMAMPEFVL
jgi:hypothetical protein